MVSLILQSNQSLNRLKAMTAQRALIALCLLVSLPLSMVSKADEAQFASQCASCHGDRAQGTELAPALAGQQQAYVQRQLEHFKTGLRGGDDRDLQGAQMKALASGLDETAIEQLAAYVAQLPTTQSDAQVATDQRRGYTYYHSTCGGCHGGQAEGNSLLNAPRLAGLSGEYLQRQMKHFSTGVRGTQKQDRFGRQMAMMSKSLDAETLADVIAFITTQP